MDVSSRQVITQNFRTTKPVDGRISLILRKIHEYLYYLCLFHSHPDSSAATRTRPDSYSSRAFVSSHSRKLANAQTERSVAATSTALVTESVLSSTYQHCYWMFLSRSPIATTDSRTRIDSYLSRAFVSSHSRKLANAQTGRSVAATSAVLVTESELSSTYQHCYWMR